MKDNTRSGLGKLFAIAMIAIGIHILRAYMAKVLPFGLVSNEVALVKVWNRTGWLLGGDAGSRWNPETP